MALVVLTIVLLLAAALTRTVVLFRQQARTGERRQQALLLAESAIQRASRAAVNAHEYSGETWHVPADVLGDGADGVVVIRVETPADSTKQRRIFVEAIYPEQGTQRFIFRREIVVEVPGPSVRAEGPPAETAS